MRILVAGATGSIGIHVVNTAIAMGHQPVTLVRNRRKIKLLPRGTDIFYGDVSIPETLTDFANIHGYTCSHRPDDNDWRN